jgi:hypothetical protein
VDGRAFSGRLVIGADGVNSVVARASGLSTGFADDVLAIDTMEETPLDELSMAEPDTMYVAYGYKGRPGYGYVFPKRHHVDAGVGFMLPFFKRTLGGSPLQHHTRFLEEAAALGIVRGRSNPENFKAYKAACDRNEVQPGRMFITEPGRLGNPKYIINFPTKRHWRGFSRMEDIETGLRALIAEVRRRTRRHEGSSHHRADSGA